MGSSPQKGNIPQPAKRCAPSEYTKLASRESFSISGPNWIRYGSTIVKPGDDRNCGEIVFGIWKSDTWIGNAESPWRRETCPKRRAWNAMAGAEYFAVKPGFLMPRFALAQADASANTML